MLEDERHTGQKLCILKSDQGGEYRSTQFMAFAAAKGITLEHGPPHTPEHNSVAERYNRTIMERTRAQMIHAGAQKTLWGEFRLATCHVLNLSPSSAIDDLPVNMWTIPSAGSGAHHGDISFLRVLAYRLWDPDTKRIVISRHVTFNESCFPMRTASVPNEPQSDIDDDEPSHNVMPSPILEQPSRIGDMILDTTPGNTDTPTTPITNTPPTRSTCMPSRYGKVVS